MENIIQTILRRCGSIMSVTEELHNVYYRGYQFLVNRLGTFVICPIAGSINSRYSYALYSGHPYIVRKIDHRKNKYGTYQITVSSGGRRFELDRIMLMAFGHYVHNEDKSQVWLTKHIDGNPLNCCIDNLKWISKVDFSVEKQIQKKGFCTKVEAKKKGISRLTLQSRLKIRSNLEECLDFKKRNRDYGIPLEELKEISLKTGINLTTLYSRYLEGDRGERLKRPCLGRGRFSEKKNKKSYPNH